MSNPSEKNAARTPPPRLSERGEHNTSWFKRAFDVLHELLMEAERRQDTGMVAVEVRLEAGRIELLRRVYNCTTK